MRILPIFLSILVGVPAALALDVNRKVYDPALGKSFPATVQVMRIGNDAKIVDACTAVKIAAYKYLTAAHCAHSLDAIYPGERIILRSAAGSQIVKVTGFEAHPRFWDMSLVGEVYDFNYQYDIAVFTVTQRTPKIPVAPIEARQIKAGETIFVGGYGTDTATNRCDNLQMDVRVADTFEGNYFGFSAKLNGRFRSAFTHGDSGGPAYVHNGKRYVVVGVNSSFTPATPILGIFNRNGKTASHICGFGNPRIQRWLAVYAR